MAQVIDTAAVRIQLDSRQAERDAKRVGEKLGKRFADGFDDGAGSSLDDVLKKASKPLTDAASKAAPQSVPVKLTVLDDAFRNDIRRSVAKAVLDAQARIPLTVDGEGFRAKVNEQVATLERSLRFDIPADPKLAVGFRQNLQAQVNAVTKTIDTSVKIDVDRGFLSTIRSAFATITGLGAGAADSIKDATGETTKLGTGLAASAAKGVAGFTSVASSVLTVAAAYAAVTVGIPALSAGISLLAGGATAAVGSIVAGFTGLPVLLTALLGPIAAITVGFNGIGKASEVLKDEAQALMRTTSHAFETGLLPVFKRLEVVFPILSAGMSEIAFSLSRFADGLADVFTSAAGLDNLKAALNGVGVFVDTLRVGVVALTTSFLNIAGTRELYEILGETIGGVLERLANMMERIRASGDLVAGLAGVRDVLLSIVDLVVVLSEGTIRFFTEAAPGLKSFFGSLTELFSRIDFAALGASFGDLISRIGEALEKIPPETFSQLADGFGRLNEQFLAFVESGGIESVIDAFNALIKVATFVNDVFVSVQEGIEGLNSVLPGLGDTLYGGLTNPFQNAINTIEALLGISSPARAFIEIAENIIAGALQGLADGPRLLFEKMSEIADKIIEALADLPDKFADLGGQAVEGFIRGIASKITSAATAAGNLARRAYEAARSAIESTSPSKLFMRLGRSTGEGFVIGVEDLLPAVLASVESLFAKVGATALAGQQAIPTDFAGSTSDAVGRVITGSLGAGRAQFPTVAELRAAFADALNAAQLVAHGDDLVLVANRAAERLGRR